MNTLLSQWVQSTHASHICAYFHHLGRFVEASTTVHFANKECQHCALHSKCHLANLVTQGNVIKI